MGNMLNSTKKFEKLITDKKDIEGLSATALGLAAQTAVLKVTCTSGVKSTVHCF